MANVCELCGEHYRVGQRIINVQEVGGQFPFKFFWFVSWHNSFIHVRCLKDKLLERSSEGKG